MHSKFKKSGQEIGRTIKAVNGGISTVNGSAMFCQGLMLMTVLLIWGCSQNFPYIPQSQVQEESPKQKEPDYWERRSEEYREYAQGRAPLFKDIPEEVFKRSKAATVLLANKKWRGSGFIFRKQGNRYFVATHSQIVSGDHLRSPIGNEIKVVVNSGNPNKKDYQGTVLAYHHGKGLAVIAIEEDRETLEVVKFANLEKLEKHREFFATAIPFSNGWNYSQAILAQCFERKFSRNPYNSLVSVELAKDLPPEYLGGPIFNYSGELVGMTDKSKNPAEHGAAIPLNVIAEFIDGTIGDLVFRNIVMDHPNRRARLSFTLNLSDPFQRIKSAGIVRLETPAPKYLPERIAFRTDGEFLQTFSPGDLPMVVTFEKSLEENPCIWYLFWVQHKDSLEKKFLFPFSFSALDDFEADFWGLRKNDDYLPSIPKTIISERLIPASTVDEGWKRETRNSLKKGLTINLFQGPSKVTRSGGGRYFLFFYDNLNTLSVFDTTSGEMVRHFNFDLPFLYASGGDRVVFYFKETNSWVTYGLANGEKIQEGIPGFESDIIDMAMGASNSHRMIVARKDRKDQSVAFYLVDSGTFESFPLEVIYDEDKPDPLELCWVNSLATDFYFREKDRIGRLFFEGPSRLRYQGRYSPSTIVQISEEGLDYTSFIIFQGRNRSMVKNFANPLVPAEKDFFLQMTDDRGKYLIPQLHSMGSLEHLFTANFRVPIVKVKNPLVHINPYYYSEEAGYFGFVNLEENRFYLRPFSAEEILKASGKDYLFIVSRPETKVDASLGFNYALKTASSRSPLNFELVEGPKQLSLSSQGVLTWTTDLQRDRGVYPVHVRVSQVDGKSSAQKFTLEVW